MTKLLDVTYQHKDLASGRMVYQIGYDGEDKKVFDVTANTKEDMQRVLVRNNLFGELTEVLSVAIDNCEDPEDRKRLRALQRRTEKGV